MLQRLEDVRAHAELAGEVTAMSAGNVVGIAASGPVLATRAGRQRKLSKATLAPALSGSDRLVMALLTVGWLTCLVAFWVWWLAPAHRVTLAGLVLNSLVLCYVSGFPLLFVLGLNWLHRVGPAVGLPPLRVAFVVTRAPSEPWDIARSTLQAMLAQRYPRDYDVWLCDERPDEEVLGWCREHGVAVSTRRGVGPYHRLGWPRRTRCKEGNLAYFYDHWGYRHYDVVAQLDCDHRPEPTYLVQVVRPFADPAVGYVATPSMCDANSATSWSARGRMYREATFHGPFQLGHSGGHAPLCIGSHYAIRTAALREIGGIGPELAEDFSTTFLLNAAGWHGVFAIDAEAHGDGPPTFSAMTMQEYQWSRSLTTILLGLLPRNLGRLPWPLRVRFLYALTYYALLTTATILGLALAPIAAVTGQPWIDVSYASFLGHWLPISVWLLAMIVLLRRRRLLRPVSAPVLSWESWLYALTRWPYVACGVAAALWQRVRPRSVTFAITPKRAAGRERLPASKVAPYAAISIASAASALIGERFTTVVGYVFLCILAATVYAVVTAVVPVLHAREAAARTGTGLPAALRQTAAGPLGVAAVVVAVTATALASFPVYAYPLLGW